MKYIVLALALVVSASAFATDTPTPTATNTPTPTATNTQTPTPTNTPTPVTAVLSGAILIDSTVANGLTASKVTVTGSGGITCSKPTTSTYTCSIPYVPSASAHKGSIIVGKYSTDNGSTAITDNRACQYGTGSVTGAELNTGSLSRTTFTYNAVMVTATDNIAIKNQSATCGGGTSTPSPTALPTPTPGGPTSTPTLTPTNTPTPTATATPLPAGQIVSGSLTIGANVQNSLAVASITVTGGNGAVCTKPTTSSYSCTLAAAGRGDVIIGGYSTQETVSTVGSNMVCSGGTPSTTSNSGSMSRTTFTYVNQATATKNLVINNRASTVTTTPYVCVTNTPVPTTTATNTPTAAPTGTPTNTPTPTAAPITKSGTVSIGAGVVNGVTTSTLNMFGTNGATCTYTKISGVYSCTLNSLGDGRITLSAYSTSPGNTANTNNKICITGITPTPLNVGTTERSHYDYDGASTASGVNIVIKRQADACP